MKNSYKTNRRSFLKTSAAAGGGLLLGFNWTSCNSPQDIKPLKKMMPENWYDMNAFLKIGDNGLVTIFSPNPEIGQNIKTSMPMIVAEELDVKWEDVIVEQAGLNTEWYTRQVAGGSQSIRQGWESLRTAGATARQMLINAAAEKWKVKPEECSVTDGIISNAKGDKMGYGEIAAAASTLAVPKEIKLKEVKDFKIIGSDKRNVDIDNILTGKALFGIDTKRKGMKYACVLRPPAFGQTLKSFDDTDALKINGVEKVIQIKVPFKEKDRFADKIAVIANSTWAAMKGKKALKAEWESTEPLQSTSDHDKELLALLKKDSKEPRRKDGDPAKAFANADEVLERIYESPFLPHNCMEPMNFFANVTPELVELVGPIQTPEWTRRRVADLLEFVKPSGDEEKDKAAYEEAFKKIKLDMTRMGGGFGRRLYGDFAIEATEISRQAKVPVQVIFSREDDMLAGTYRPAIKYKIQAAIKDKKITGYRLAEAGVNANMFGSIPNNFPAGAIENYQVDNHQMKSLITVGAWRAPYTNFLAYAEQSFFDELAEKLEKDPIELRLELLEGTKKNFDEHAKLEADIKDEEKLAEAKKKIKPKGNYEPDRFIGVIKLAAEKANWGNAPAGIHQGFSVYYSHNTYVAEVANILLKDGKPKIKSIICAVDCGIVVNPIAAKNQVEGGVIDGVGHAMYGDFMFEAGRAVPDNFDKYRMIRMDEAPKVEVHFVQSDISPTGLGEPALPPAGGAVANAIHAATGTRLYKQPFAKQHDLPG